MQSIRSWLSAHPKSQQKVLNYDPSFVFFKKVPGDQPIGAQGVPLTPSVSLAVDRHYTRLGTPMWLSTRLPKSPQLKDSGHRYQALMVAQDTGGAIKGRVRGDVFWGEGKRAELLAGLMKSKGKYWLLIPKVISVAQYVKG